MFHSAQCAADGETQPTPPTNQYCTTCVLWDANVRPPSVLGQRTTRLRGRTRGGEENLLLRGGAPARVRNVGRNMENELDAGAH